MKRTIFWVLLSLAAGVFLRELLIHKQIFLIPYDSSYWEKRYLNSQWAKGWEAEEKMGDAELYAYAGWRQIKGEDPTKINPETPPLGKYLIGLSILIFRNPVVISPVLGVLFLVSIFLLAKKILKDNILAIIPVFLIILDPLFRENLITTMLDLPFSLFITLAFLCLLKGKENKFFYFLSLIFLGGVAATKMYLVGFGLVGVFLFYLFLLLVFQKRKDVFWFLGFLPAFALVYLGSYIVYFLNGHNFWDFKYLHFWIRHFARVQVAGYPKGEILRILFLGQWRTWWDEGRLVKVSVWRPWWSLGILAIFPSILEVFFKKHLDLLIFLIWPIYLLVIFSIGVPYPRYLLPVLPSLYILLCYNLKKLFGKWKK